MIQIIGLEGIPLIKRGDDLGQMIVKSAEVQNVGIMDDDIIVVTQKIVSKAEGRVVDLNGIQPSDFAKEIARSTHKDPQLIECILKESSRIVEMKRNILITETKHGFVCANAGIDRSNIAEGFVSLLPRDPDVSADRIRSRIKELTQKEIAVVITDTWGRPWRLGQVDFAIGVSGMKPLKDYRGLTDGYGYELSVTNIAVADELASASELAKGKLKHIPVVIIRGYGYEKKDGHAKQLIRPLEEDLFR